MSTMTSSTAAPTAAASARLLLARGTDRLDWSLVADFVEVPWPAGLVALESALAQVAAEENHARSRHLNKPLANPGGWVGPPGQITRAPLALAWLVEDAVFSALCPAWRPSMDPLSEQAHETRRAALVTLQAHVQPLSMPMDGPLDELALMLTRALGAMEDQGATHGARLKRVAARLQARPSAAAGARDRGCAAAGAPMAEAVI
jgi:hypothetical protein